jgi:tetratricopeptide (TPR) repeat protein
MRSALLTTLLSCALAAQSPAPTPTPAAASTTPALAVRLQTALRRGQDDLRQLQGELAQVDHPRKAYYQALVAYSLAGQLRGQEPTKARALVDQALAALAPLRDADSLALQAGLLGLKIGFDPSQGMTLSPRAQGLLGEAKGLAPRNPRVRLFEGIHLLHTPVAFGGGATAGLPALTAAAELAASEPRDAEAWTPSWGRAETLAWRALAELDLGQRAQAEGHLAEALALDPAYGFARGVVAPRLKAPVQGGRP